MHWGGLLASWATVFIVPLTVWLAYTGNRQAKSGEIAARASVVSADAARDGAEAARVGAEAARISANAARETAGLLIAQEAPQISFRFDREVDQVRLDPDSGLSWPRTKIYYRFVNYGRTPAICQYHQVEMKLGGSTSVETKDKFHYEESTIPPGEHTPPLIYEMKRKLTVQDLVEIDARRSVLRIASAIHYRDVFGTDHSRRFGLVFDHQMKRWRVDTTDGLDV